MLTRPERLTSRQFEAAFSRSRTHRDALLSLRVHWREGPARPALRAAFVVPKKLGKAAWRNRTRRRMQEAFRLQRDALQVLAGPIGAADCIFLAQPAAHDADFETLKRSVRSLVQRAAEEKSRQEKRSASASRGPETRGEPGASGAP